MRPSWNSPSVSVARATLLFLLMMLLILLPSTTTASAAARSIGQQQQSSGRRSRMTLQLVAEDIESQETNAIEQNSSSGRFSEGVADNGEVQSAAQGRLLDWLEEVSDAIQNFQSQVDWHPEELVREMEEFMQMELDTIQSLLDDSEIGRQLQDIMDNMMMLFTPIPGGLSGTHRRSLLSSPIVTPRRTLDNITSHRAVASPQLHRSRKLLNSGAMAVDSQNLEQSDDVQQPPYSYLLDGEDGSKYDNLDISQLMDLYPADLREAGVLGSTNTSPNDSPLPEEDDDKALTKSLMDVDVSELMLLQPHVVTGFEGQLDLLEELIDAMQRTMAKLGDAIAIGIQSSDAPIYLNTPWLDIYPDDYNMAPPSAKHGKMAAQHKHYPAGNAPGYAENDYQYDHLSTTTATTAPLAVEPQPAFDTIPRGLMST